MGISIHRILGTAVHLCVAFLCAVAHNVTDHKTMGAAAVQNTFQVFQLFGFDDDFQLFESQLLFFGDFTRRFYFLFPYRIKLPADFFGRSLGCQGYDHDGECG